ncbi:hypothetical protein T4D_13386 [Trichinella pseudospiralis]|uniref:Uncharacterized protein n=1 Tax=Trichinella pseudospiralis TaxID=6337 RepID=A0A0V1FRJ7_TRIPS|nr:hypothetical protein T4D_13386 [Trichinella pseudospiralis]
MTCEVNSNANSSTMSKLLWLLKVKKFCRELNALICEKRFLRAGVEPATYGCLIFEVNMIIVTLRIVIDYVQTVSQRKIFILYLPED